jgi:hypothetical protein
MVLKMKNIILITVALALIAIGIFLGIGIRTKANIVEKPQELKLTEKIS